MEPTAAYKAGQIIGILIFVGGFAAFVVFSILAIIKAFKKRSIGWIIAGIFCGLLLSLPILALTAVFVKNVIKGFKQGRASAASRHETPFPVNHPSIVTGHKVPYTMKIPAGWQARNAAGAFDQIVNRGDDYVGVIAEGIALKSSEDAASLARQNIRSQDADARISDNDRLTMDGKEWVQFSSQATLGLIPFAHHYFVYSGGEGTYEVVGWTGQNLIERDREAILEVMKTFQFPPVRPADTAVSPTPAPSKSPLVDPFHVGLIP